MTQPNLQCGEQIKCTHSNANIYEMYTWITSNHVLNRYRNKKKRFPMLFCYQNWRMFCYVYLHEYFVYFYSKNKSALHSFNQRALFICF